MPVITLTTDFGIKDGNVGVMKGVIWGISPEVQIADLSHLISPQNISEAALILSRSAPYFPEGTIHVVVVDPGVGTARHKMAAKIGTQYYVGPDNGTISLLLEKAEQLRWESEFVMLTNPQYWLPEVSFVFHGRDIFAPVAAHLSIGVSLAALGTPLENPVRLQLPKPEKNQNGWRGEIIHIDHFGNISSNIRVETLGDWLENKENISVLIAGVKVKGLVHTFGERPTGELIALIGSTGNLILSVVNGSASERLNTQLGDLVEIIMETSSR